MSGLSIHALVTAAGSSERFGADQPKQYMLLRGRPLLAHSIDAVRRHPSVKAVHVTLAADDQLFQDLLATRYGDVIPIVGGESRAESVFNGLQQIARRDPDCEWVLVHDAARPCLSRDSLYRLIDEGVRYPDGGILAAPVVDTLKHGESGRIVRTIDRSLLWAAQTPQLFPLQTLMQAIDKMLDSGETPTDEASAMEFMGFKPHLVMGDSSNIKVTVASDLALAEFILNQRNGMRDGSRDV